MSKNSGRILVVDDDRNICELIRLYLEKEGFEVRFAHRGDEAAKAVEENDPALVLLDVMLPAMDGWEVLRELRRTVKLPIMMLTAKGETYNKVKGLELGADDYLAKPFEPDELTARVKALLRRAHPESGSPNTVSYDGLEINLSEYAVIYKGAEVDMPPKEIELLHFLASHPGNVYTREQLLEYVWNFGYFGDSRTVDVHIKRLRDKLSRGDESWQIKTVWGVGYKFEVL